MGKPAVFLDRDGVINEAPLQEGKPESPVDVKDLVLLPGVPEACRRLKKAGFILICVTNQPNIARGNHTRAQVDAINAEIRKRVSLDDIRVCPHDDKDQCKCRKPEPGLILDAAKEWGVDPSRSYMVGDRWRDVEAGRRAGCRTILVGGGYSEPFPSEPHSRVESLSEAARVILIEAAPQ